MAYTSQYTGAQIDSAIGTIVNGYFKSYTMTGYWYPENGRFVGKPAFGYSNNILYNIFFKDENGNIYNVDYEISDSGQLIVYSNVDINGTLYVSLGR